MSAAVLCLEARQSQPTGSMPRCKWTCSLPTPHLSDPRRSEYSASVQQSHRTNGTRSAGRAKAFYLAAFPQPDLKSGKRQSTDCCMSKHTSTAVGAEQALTSLEGETTAGKGWRSHPLYSPLCTDTAFKWGWESWNHPTHLLRISFLLFTAWLKCMKTIWEYTFPVRSTYHCFSGKVIQAYPGVTKLKKVLWCGSGLNINFLPFWLYKLTNISRGYFTHM